MCGICGIYGPASNRISRVQSMMKVLEHRGPDDSGSFDDGVCALGHRRLSIIDLSARGKQPMGNETGTVWLVVNGEIYNYKDLRIDLQSLGHIFCSDSDSEVIIHAYEEYGFRVLGMLRGMFAFALYDKNQEQVILARDPIGKKPLYYTWYKRQLIWGSEIKALLEVVPREVNYDAIPSYLMYQYVPGGETMFRGIRKLPAGHALLVSAKGAVLRQYWHIPEGQCDDRPIEQLRDTLETAVELRLQADVPIGSFLSGGIDSSAVTALYRRHSTGDFHTFTATFPGHSEASYARIVSQHLGTQYHEVEITPQMVARDIERVTWHHDEPLGDAAVLNNYYLSQEAKKYVTVVLAGEGGDEVFGGYPWHRYVRYIAWMNRIPPFIRQAGPPLLQLCGVGNVSSRWYGMGRVAMFPCQGNLTDMLMYPTTAMSSLTVRWLLGNKRGLRMRPAVPDTVHNLYNQALAMDCLNLLPEKFLMKADKATMAFGVEERLPLLDKEVIDLAFCCAPKLKRDKYILRKAVEDLLPPEIVWRTKQGFGTPMASWFQELDVNNRILDGRLLREICTPRVIETVVRSNSDRKTIALNPLGVVWGLYALQVWHDVWFGNRTEKEAQ